MNDGLKKQFFFWFYLVFLTLALSITNNAFCQSDKNFQLPEVKPQEDKGAAAIINRIYVRDYVFIGNRAFTREELLELTAEYKNREVSYEELENLRQKITKFYVEKGYVNSGAIIPDQKLTDSVVTFQIVEGTLSKIEIRGNKKLKDSYYTKRLTRSAGPPLNVYEIQKGLQLLQQNPLVKRVNASLNPGIKQGESTLEVEVDENKAFKYWLTVSNDYSPTIGGYGASANIAHNNLTGHADILNVKIGATNEFGLVDYNASYDLPINSRDTTISLKARKNETTVLEAPFEDLDIESRSDTFGLGLTHPIIKTPNTDLKLGLTGELRKSETFLLGRRFSFSEGTEDGQSKITVLRLSQEWTRKTQRQVFAAMSTFSFGINAIDATINESGPDGRFSDWLGQFQYVRRLRENNTQLIFKAYCQLTMEPLLPLEQFSIGGVSTVRGYRLNEIVRDNGAVASLELRLPVYSYANAKGLIVLAPFIDYGTGWNTDRDTPEPKNISSAGLGLRWDIYTNINLQVYAGIPFRNIEHSEETLQDSGIHFNFTAGGL
ncbi:polypeptide-transport-associated domain-containing protein [Candidatus Magnetoovum chiemensis]|nr:polypeptide-transport-associated domain-containing protein [Candidatus Magnetoovum chiemensis]